jgi:hypothetical protein
MAPYIALPGRWRREFVTMAEQPVVDAIGVIAASFSRYDRKTAVATVRDVEAKAVQIYLYKAVLGWSLSRIGRRFPDGISLQYAMLLYPRGRDLIARAVACGRITPATLARLLPARTYF